MRQEKEDPYIDIIESGRPRSSRVAMDIPHRAKQFAPFDALRGFNETVHVKELIFEPRKVLSTEKQEEIDSVLRSLKPGMRVTAVWFLAAAGKNGLGTYECVTGRVGEVGDGVIAIAQAVIPIGSLAELYEADADML